MTLPRQREWTAPLASLVILAWASFGLVLIESTAYFGLLDPWGLKVGALFLVAASLGMVALIFAALPHRED